ncbi:MAG: metallophosphoesterase [Candidatus Hydrogenedentes bacterium]|nr:metallophosphoesterase [Candidatus Hydrogenedentota bacterium]
MAILSRRDFLRVSATGIMSAGLISTRANAADSFTFAAINDTHIKDAPSVDILNETVARINKDTRINFSCILGDIATGGTQEELALAQKALKNLDTPIFAVPGNHDVFLDAPDIYANYVTAFGPIHWIHKQNDWAFIGFSSCDGTKSDVTVGKEELTWLQESLKEIAPQQPIALFCHHPLNPNSKAYRIQNADDILALFSGHNLKMVASGHWHGNQLEDQDEISFATTACCSTTRSNFDKTTAKGYRLFHIQGDTVTTEFVVVQS